MGSNQDLNVKWEYFTDHLQEMLKQMYTDEFSDVTLICDDLKQFTAHRNILSACSKTFQEIFRNDKIGSQSIYLKGIGSLELEAVLKFVYMGETRCTQDRIEKFIDVAKSLKIKELSEIDPKNQLSQISNFQEEGKPYRNTSQSRVPVFVEDSQVEVKSEPIEGTPTVQNDFSSHVVCHVPNCGMEMRGPSPSRSLFEHFEAAHKDQQLVKKESNKKQQYQYSCKYCLQKYDVREDLREHIETTHEKDDGTNFYCNQCSFKADSQNAVDLHKVSKHAKKESITQYACFACSFKVLSKDKLKEHIITTHQELIPKPKN